MKSLRLISRLSITLMLVIGFSTSGFPGGKDARADDLIEVSVGVYPPNIYKWPFYVATDLGFWEEEGVSIKDVLVTANDGDALRALAAGETAIGETTTSLQVVDQGTGDDMPIYIAQPTFTPLLTPFTFVGPAENVDQGMASLEGELVAVPPVGSVNTAVALSILDEQVGEGKYEPLHMSGGTTRRVAALDAGRVKAAWALSPYGWLVQDEFPNLTILDFVDNYVTDIAGSGWNAQRKWLDNNKEAAIRWCRAYNRANVWIQNPANRQRAVGILAKNLEVSIDAADKAYARYVAPFDDTRTAHVIPESIKKQQQVMLRYGYLDSELDISTLYDNSCMDAATGEAD